MSTCIYRQALSRRIRPAHRGVGRVLAIYGRGLGADNLSSIATFGRPNAP